MDLAHCPMDHASEGKWRDDQDDLGHLSMADRGENDWGVFL